jgi:hypothetical protein
MIDLFVGPKNPVDASGNKNEKHRVTPLDTFNKEMLAEHL